MQVHVVDTDNQADVKGATVTATPGAVKAVTDNSGRATFPSLATGLYQITVAAPGLVLQGTTVVPGTIQTVTTDWTSITAGATVHVDVKLRRIDKEALNLVTLHDGKAPAFTEANCIACHNDRADELSTDPAGPPYHALPAHNGAGCTTCHKSVDLDTGSGASIRKQVSVTLCKGCHVLYPASY